MHPPRPQIRKQCPTGFLVYPCQYALNSQTYTLFSRLPVSVRMCSCHCSPPKSMYCIPKCHIHAQMFGKPRRVCVSHQADTQGRARSSVNIAYKLPPSSHTTTRTGDKFRAKSKRTYSQNIFERTCAPPPPVSFVADCFNYYLFTCSCSHIKGVLQSARGRGAVARGPPRARLRPRL